MKSIYVKSLLVCAFLTLSSAVVAQQKAYTIVFLKIRDGQDKIDEDSVQKLMEGHMANIRRLSKEGKLLVAGPFDGGGGIFIFNTTSPEEAESWLNTDPGVRAQRWTIEILPYIPRVGSVCPQAEPVEMVSYTFVRFTALVQKYTAKRYPFIIRQHERYLKRVVDPADIITEAIFGPNEGGVLLLRSDMPNDAFSDDPGVQQALLDVQIKKLYVAKNSFCENP